MNGTYPLTNPYGQYAQLVHPNPFQQFVTAPPKALATAGEALLRKEGNDGDLAHLDDTLKLGGSFFIATLTTLGTKASPIGEFLGFGSWFAAMSLTPLVINSLVRLKTGIPQGLQYKNSDGQVKSLFQDPQYLPLYLITDEEMAVAARRLKVPTDRPDWRNLTEDKIKQVAIQTRAWWMMMAGPATPLLSGLLCDTLESPITQAVTGLRNQWQRLSQSARLHRAQALVGSSRPEDAAALKLESHQILDELKGGTLKHLVGETPQASLSQWWGRFGPGVVRASGLAQALPSHQVIAPTWEGQLWRKLTGRPPSPRPSTQALLDAIVQHFQKTVPEKPQFLMDLQAYLRREKRFIDGLGQDIHQRRALYEAVVGPEEFKQVLDTLEARKINARSTIEHYEALVKRIQQGMASQQPPSAAEIRDLLEGPVSGRLRELVQAGRLEAAQGLMGGAENDALFRRVRGLILGTTAEGASLPASQAAGRAGSLLGASPAHHLTNDALQQVMRRRLWQHRMFRVGAAMLGATVLYTQCVIGKTTRTEASS